MTIEKGQPWGSEVPRPPNVQVVDSDAALVHALADPAQRPVAVNGGDLHSTLGNRDVTTATSLRRLPIDLLAVTLDEDATHLGAAHVTMQSPRFRGGRWRGPLVIVMNAEFLGSWHVAAGGHPNDGRAESCEWQADFPFRQRVQAFRRMPGNSHVPHPEIETHSFRQRSWTFDSSTEVIVDGVEVGRCRSVHVSVLPDEAVIFA